MGKFIAAMFATFMLALPARAEVFIDIDAGKVDPLPIAIMDFAGRHGDEIGGIIRSNLKRSGIFAPIAKGSFIDREQPFDKSPNFNNWSVINASALAYGQTKVSGESLTVAVKLYDIPSRRLLVEQTFSTDVGNRRRIAHIISDIIYSKLTGDKGYFDTRIVYIAETGPKTDRTRRLAIMDQDGANLKYLTSGNISVTTPAFSPNSQKITYVGYHGGTPRVYVYDLETSEHTLIGDFPGMSFAPRFSPDGKYLIMSIAKEGTSDIYEMELSNKKMTRLTSSIAIDTAPSYSPDGKKIAFVSDRSGSPQIYVMDRGGRKQERVSFGQGQYGDVAWSPRGDYLAFVKILRNKFYVGVMFEDGTGERILASGHTVESPTFSPNGRRIIYYEEGVPDKGGDADVVIKSVDITGFGLETIPTPTKASDPAWSPLLQ